MTATGYYLTAPSEPLALRPLTLPDPGPDEVVLEVEACGLCHTDLSFANGSVRPRHALPLVLGHEITGRVVAAGDRYRQLEDRPVLVPAVLPCGHCAFCRAGRSNACPDQKMPGNDIDGGFATHVLVPAAPLVPLDDAPPGFPLAELAVVADAVSTAYQAIRRAGLAAGDAVFVVGAGGVGGFLIQIACALGARVVACDISSDRLVAATSIGAEHTVDITGRDTREVRGELRNVAGGWGIPSFRQRIFECSGTAPGQTLAYALLGPAATLMVIGYTPEKLSLRLSNLMAFDASVHGTWGCPPEVYPQILKLIYDGSVVLSPFVDHAPMSDLDRLLDDMAHHRLTRRMILHPEA